MALFEQKYVNNIRTITGLAAPAPVVTVTPFQDDCVLEVDTTLGAVVINLLPIPTETVALTTFGKWSTQYKLYIIDKNGTAATNNITVNAPAGGKINGAASFTIDQNNASLICRVSSNTSYVGQYSVISSGLTTLTATDSSTVDLTLTPIAGGFNLLADVKFQDSITAVKAMTTTNTSYCLRTNQFGLLMYNTLVGVFIVGETITGSISGATGIITTDGFGTIQYNTPVGVFVTGETITGGTSGATANLVSVGKYENPFQSITNGSVFDNYNAPTETGAMIGSFNAATGEWTAPSTGYYYIQSQLGYALNATSPYLFTSDNPNTLNQAWMNGTDVGSFSITNYLVGSGLASVALKTLTNGSSQLYLYSNVLIKLNAGNVIKVVYTNNSDLEMYGQPNSNVIFRAVKLSS